MRRLLIAAATMAFAAPAGAAGLVFAPAVPQPHAAGEIVGFLLQNIQRQALPARDITFGEVFLPGQVAAPCHLAAEVAHRSLPVQCDVKTRHADGSVRLAVLTLAAPPLPSGASLAGMLIAGEAAPSAPVDLAPLAAGGDVTIDLLLHGTDGTTTPFHISRNALLTHALQGKAQDYWLRGPLASELRVTTQVVAALRMVLDIRAMADGGALTDIVFDNDLAMQKTGGTLLYDVTIRQGERVVMQKTGLKHYQYQDWRAPVWSAGAPGVNVVHDIAYLERTGAIANYDLKTGVSAALIAREAQLMHTPGFGAPLAANGVTQYMSMTGGRGDIGPTTEANTVWLVTQNPDAAAYALAQAAAAGSVPWHMFNPATGQYLTTRDYPNVWADPRGTFTQPIRWPTDGWTPDSSHMPDLSYDAYLLTGSRYHLDELNAQAAWAITCVWPGTRSFNGSPDDIVINPGDQTRESAWSIREVDEAAYANPAGSAAKAYFTQVENDNYSWIVSQLPAWTKLEGQAYGYLPGANGDNDVPPWQQDYLASAVIQAVEMGNADAKTFLQWMSNFLVGRFTNAANGFNPNNGVAYNITMLPKSDGGYQVTARNGRWVVQPGLQTWHEIQQATHATGWQDNGNGWSHSQGDFAQLAAQSLAGIITVLDDPEAIKAYRWLLHSGAPFLGTANFQQDPTYNIVPRMRQGE